MTTMADLNLQEIHNTLISVAHEAGRMILSANPSDISTGTKLNSADIVTETDKAVEALVSSRLSKAYPSFAFIGEETYKPGMQVTTAPTFIVDPIDGTTNFVHGFPSACISLGFAVDRRPAVGVVYNPYLDQLYTAIRGKGAYLTHGAVWGLEGGKGYKYKLPLAKNPQPLLGLNTSLVAIEWGSSRDGVNYEVKTDVFKKLCASKESGGAMVHSLRSMGSAALNLCAVAAGQLDSYWEGGCWAWDVCAGWAILTEAGGIMAGGNPGVWEPKIDERKYLAVRGAPSGQEGIVEEFWKVVGEGRMEYES
ncbi:inositol monophosphatase [Hypoxylon crocopeplum]|nr:inositol monophosphatase [Hypoxylon crocopeplum]